MAIKVPINKQVYKVVNNEKLQKYEYATQILNRYKLSDGSLPKVEDIKAEIEKFENRKTDYEAHNQKLKSELQRYEIVQYNLERLVDEPKEIEEKPKQKQKNIYQR
jgi:dTDP-4-dehydrorhamnose reductase